MDALTLLTQRKSNKKLTAPAPSQVQLEQMFQAALHAPDHGKLEPYHFVVIQGTGLSKLESLLKAAVAEFELGEERLKKAENFARRAPMVIAVIAKINHEVKKVPGWEQMLTAGAATYAIQLTGNALGFESFWATGPLVEGREFVCGKNDKIVALLQIGTAAEKLERDCKPKDLSRFVNHL